jgi:hypothetical protein
MVRPSKYPRELREGAALAVGESVAQGEYPLSFVAIRTSLASWGSGFRRRCASGCSGPRWTAARAR